METISGTWLLLQNLKGKIIQNILERMMVRKIEIQKYNKY